MSDDEGSIFSRFFNRGGQKESSKKLDQLRQLRDLSAYKNLKDKFAGKSEELQGGLPKDGLTVGDLVDIVHLYRTSANYTIVEAFLPIASIVRTITIPEGQDVPVIEKELTKLEIAGDTDPSSFDRNNPLYSLHPDLSFVVSNKDDDLSHYPGGISITNRPESSKQDPRFELFLNNRQSADDGKPVKQIFQETGIPFAHNSLQ